MDYRNCVNESWNAIKAAVDPWYHHQAVQVPLWSLVYIVRYAWRNVYPLTALAAGVVFVVGVGQTPEILANLVVEPQELKKVDATQIPHAVFFILALMVWALSTWYAMRLLSSTRFPADHPPHPHAAASVHWLNEELPRLGPLAGVATIACTASIFLAEDPTARWMPLLAAGIVPLTWSVASAADRVLRRWKGTHERLYPVQLIPIALIALGAAAAGWSSLPALRENEPWLREHWTALFLAVATLLLVLPWWLGRTGTNENRKRTFRRVVDLAMLALAALWLVVALAGAAEHRGFGVSMTILMLAAMGLWATSRRRELLGMPGDPGTPHSAEKPMVGPFRIGLPTAFALGITFGFLVLFAVGFAKAPIILGNWMGTLAIVFVGLALWSFFGALWIYLPKLAGWPALGAVPILWLVVIGHSPDHSLRDASYRQAATPRPTLEEHFVQWQKTLPAGEARPIFFVAAAGGGLRAAFWTANVLATADDATCGEFGRHVYAYSGVSGGSLGIAAYLAQRQVWEAKKLKDPKVHCVRGRKEEITRMLGRDFLAPVAGSIMFAELASRFVHAPLDNDRGTALAKSWSRAWDEEFRPAEATGRFDRGFLEVFAAFSADGRAGPAVFLNATGVDSGRQVIVSNVANRVGAALGSVDLLREERKVALKTAGLPVREAVLNSARFTYVSPAGAVYKCNVDLVDGRCPDDREAIWERLVDGGYFENSGVATLSDVIQGLMASGMRKDNVFVIVIDNSSEPVLACRPRGMISMSEVRA